MIKNKKQYALTQQLLADFRDALTEVEQREEPIEILKRAEIDGIKSKIEEFEADLEEYARLEKGEIGFFIADSLEEFQTVLIKARIVKGLSQGQLAGLVGIKEQQIQRYEACNYRTATVPRLIEVANALGIGIPPFKIDIQRQYLFTTRVDPQMVSDFQKRVSKSKSLMH